MIGGPDDGVITPWESRYYFHIFSVFLNEIISKKDNYNGFLTSDLIIFPKTLPCMSIYLGCIIILCKKVYIVHILDQLTVVYYNNDLLLFSEITVKNEFHQEIKEVSLTKTDIFVQVNGKHIIKMYNV